MNALVEVKKNERSETIYLTSENVKTGQYIGFLNYKNSSRILGNFFQVYERASLTLV